MKRWSLWTVFIFLFITGVTLNVAHAVMEDYCLVPPYVIQNNPPNVMIVMDNSGSMFNFAYYDGYDTLSTSDDNMCDDVYTPCTAYDPTHTYYGYFNSSYWYSYGSNKFQPTVLKSSRAKGSSEWDGNFLNWLTMRRIDIIRKVMTGGKTTSQARLVAEQADWVGRGVYKSVTNFGTYGDSGYSGDRCVRLSSGGSRTPYFTVLNDDNGACYKSYHVSGTYTIQIEREDPTQPVEGVLQQVAGTRARVGLALYHVNATTPEGGFIQTTIDGSSLTSTINQINLTRPDSNTPLAETLWTVTGYFAQQSSMLSGPGPRYQSGDYQINNNVDPYNFGTGGAPRYPSCAKSFVLYITDGEPCQDGNLPATLTDYAGTQGSIFNCSGTNCTDLSATYPTFTGGAINSCGWGSNVAGLEDVALYAHTTDLRTPSTKDITDVQNLTVYTVFAFGTGSTLLRYAAINGGFEDVNGNNLPDLQTEWDNNGDKEPDNFYEATEGAALETAIRNAFSNILKRASSGTAASVLASGEGSGANLVQAVFYPRRRFGNDIIAWNGVVQNLWYYVDPLFTNSSIREDSTSDNILNLKNDNIVSLYFDTVDSQTKAARCSDTDGDGDCDVVQPTIKFESLASLWEAGNILWQRDPATRTIYTTLDGANLLTNDFTTSNDSSLAPYLQAVDVNGDGSAIDDADYIINYIRGQDFPGVDRDADGKDDFRSRTASIGADALGNPITHVWKLGDIINSTPRISSWLPLNKYHHVYDDTTYGKKDEDPALSDPADATHFITSSNYKSRGAVFVGANDGMLHAFNLGSLELDWTGQNKPEEIAHLSGVNLGKEMWAFVPLNALPYLKYQAQQDYCHLFSVDLSPYVFDASIGGGADASKVVGSWRTVLIGGMRFGGACKNSCTSSDCVETPMANVGYSSYFALDVTDPNVPTLLWEFSSEDLGYSTTGPAVVRIGGAATNGHWYVVLGSGPTGPIDTANYQFLGRSDQNLRLFVLDLKTGALLRTIDTGIPYAFAGSMMNSTIDPDLDYSDDAVYLGYVKRQKVGGNYIWNQGGVGRLFTKEDTDPANWAFSKVIDDTGPVTAGISKLQDKTNYNIWLYFGTGRFYFDTEAQKDDPTDVRQLVGIKEPCFDYATGQLNPGCTTTVTTGLPGPLTDVTNVSNAPGNSVANGPAFKGWYLDLDASGTYTYPEGGNSVTRDYLSERVITDPLAVTTGVVFYTTYKPYNESCSIGGKSFIWAIKYNTGGAPGNLLKGKAMVQISTGSIEQIDIASEITGAGGRKSAAMEGVPPTGSGLSVQTTPPPTKTMIHKRVK